MRKNKILLQSSGQWLNQKKDQHRQIFTCVSEIIFKLKLSGKKKCQHSAEIITLLWFVIYQVNMANSHRFHFPKCEDFSELNDDDSQDL